VIRRLETGQLYNRWMGLWAMFHRGYWFVASLYLVLDARLSAFQLVIVGVVQSVISVVCEVPAGVVADRHSRKWSLVVAHLLMGAAIVWTGLVTSFPVIVATQALWGIAWTFASGADIAWVTDELNSDARIDTVLASADRSKALGAALGIACFGVLAWLTSRGLAIVVAGAAIIILGLVATAVPETKFVRGADSEPAWEIFRRGVQLTRHNRVLVVVFLATLLSIGAAGEGYNRMYAKQLVDVGFPQGSRSIVWFGALNLLTLLGGAVAMHRVVQRISQPESARHYFALACIAGAFGVSVLALAPNSIVASIGAVVAGSALLVARSVGGIWANRQSTNDVRATVHSLIRQGEYVGEIVLGFGLGTVARIWSVSFALLGSALLFVLTSLLLGRSGRISPNSADSNCA
jgi:MFS family permease